MLALCCCMQANSVIQNEVSVDRWLHRFIIGPKGANIKQITQDFPKVCVYILVHIVFILVSHTHTHTHGLHHRDDVGSIALVISEWVGEWTVRFWMSSYSNNVTVHLTSTMIHWHTFTMNCFKWEMVVCQIPLSLPAEVDADRHKDCDVLANQSRCSKLSRLHRWSVHSYSGLQLLYDHLF